jgi:hypothetical protein
MRRAFPVVPGALAAKGFGGHSDAFGSGRARMRRQLQVWRVQVGERADVNTRLAHDALTRSGAGDDLVEIPQQFQRGSASGFAYKRTAEESFGQPIESTACKRARHVSCPTGTCTVRILLGVGGVCKGFLPVCH